MLLRNGRPKKPVRGLFDFLRERKPERAEGTFLLIDWAGKNIVDRLFITYYLQFRKALAPQRLKGWWCIGKNGEKVVMGRITDILPTRDIMVKEKATDKLSVVIPFEHVVELKPNKP